MSKMMELIILFHVNQSICFEGPYFNNAYY